MRADAGRIVELSPPASNRPFAVIDDGWQPGGGRDKPGAGLWDRGRDVWERWRHRETGEERVLAGTALLDYGFAEGHERALKALIEHLIGVTHSLGRAYLVAPLETLPEVAALLEARRPIAETRYLQWRAEQPALTPPPYLDLVYW